MLPSRGPATAGEKTARNDLLLLRFEVDVGMTNRKQHLKLVLILRSTGKGYDPHISKAKTTM